MSDIVERLHLKDGMMFSDPYLFGDAIAEIERLRSVNAFLVAALEKVAEDTGSPDAIDAIALAKGDKP